MFTIYYTLTIISIGLIVICFSNYYYGFHIFNFRYYIKNIFLNIGKDRIKGYFVTFFIIPIIIGGFLAKKHSLLENEINSLLGMFSIIIGFLFSLLVIIIDRYSNLEREISNRIDKKQNYLREKMLLDIYIKLNYISMLTILLTIINLILLMLLFITLPNFINYTINMIIYGLSINFILNLLYILRNFSIVIEPKK